MTRSPPGASSSSISGPLQMSPSSASQNSSYNSATWERTLRMNSSASLVVPPPLGSAPTTMSPQHGHHKPVRASLSSLSGSQQHIEQPQSMSMSPAQVASQSNNHGQAEEWYRGNNKISTAKTLQLQRQLSTGASATSSTAGIHRFMNGNSHGLLGRNVIRESSLRGGLEAAKRTLRRLRHSRVEFHS